MVDAIGVAGVTADMLKRLWAANQGGGAAAVSAEVTNIASSMGTSTQAVWNGVVAAQGSSDAAVAGWAGTVAEGVAAGELGLTGEVVAAAAAPATAGGVAGAWSTVAGWWGSLGAATQVVLIGGVIVVLVAGGGWVAGWWSEDREAAVTAVEVAPEDGGTEAGGDVSGEEASYGGEATLAADSAFTLCPDRSNVDGSFTLEVLEDGTPVDGDLEVGGDVPVSFGDITESNSCATTEILCRLEFLFTSRVRSGITTYDYTAGRVSGPGHENQGCNRADYVEDEEAHGPASITLDELTEESISGDVTFEGAPFLEFSGTRRD